MDHIWPRLFKNDKENSQMLFRQTLKMRSLSKFWLTFVDQSDVMLDLHCSVIMKRMAPERATALGSFKHWQPRLVL
jgi:hypothetical protein